MYICRHTFICIYIYIYIDITNLNALYTQRSKMLLNNDIQVQRPNTLHNKIQPTYFPLYSSQTIWSKPSACPVTLTPCCLRSIVKTFALSHASTRARPDSFMLERFHSFDSTKKTRLTAKAINQLQQWVHLSHLQASIGQLICTVLHCLPKGLRWPKGVTVSDS